MGTGLGMCCRTFRIGDFEPQQKYRLPEPETVRTETRFVHSVVYTEGVCMPHATASLTDSGFSHRKGN